MWLQINCFSYSRLMSLTYKIALIFAMIYMCSSNLIFCTDQELSETDLFTYSKALTEVFQLVNTRAYFPIYFRNAMNKALDAFVHADEYSHFLGPKDYKDLIKSTNGEFYGIGIAIAPKRKEDDFLLVLKVLPNSPASKKNIKKYDKIIAIDDNPVGPLSIEEAVSKLKGETRFSTVKVDIIRDTKIFISITLERDIVKEENIKNYYIANKQIFYCALSNFTSDIGQKLRTQVKKALKFPLKGIILDLRDNPGGILESAVDCASIFLKKNSLIVVTKNRHNQVIEHCSTQLQPVINKSIPLVILVNNYTASAAEILAGALQDHAARAKPVNPHVFILGTETYGKGLVQEVIPLSNDCALKITTSLYYLPGGRSINKIGINPDFVVNQKYAPPKELKLLDKLYGKKNNIKTKQRLKQDLIDKSKPNTKKLSTEKAQAEKEFLTNKSRSNQQKNILKEDYQFRCAINLIEILTLGKQLNGTYLHTKQKAKDFLEAHSCWCSNLDLTELK